MLAFGQAFLTALWGVLLELSPWLLLGAIVAGALHVVLPPDFVRRSLSGRGGVLKAVLLGVPLPLCSCGVIPAGLGLRRDGASNGASVAFLIATPQTGVDSILVSGSLLGWPFAVFKVLSAGFLGVVGGLWAEHLAPEPAAAEPAAPVAAARPSVREGIDHGVDMVRTIWRWLVLGVLLSALITVLVPPQAFAGLGAAGGLLAMLAVLAIATPLYVCATASVPIAAALVAGGFPPGAALVFLMAGPATNVATIGAVRRAFGGRILVAYLTTVVLGSLVLGATFDAVLTTPAAVSGLHPHAGPIGTLSAAVLVALLAFFAFEELRRWWRPAEAPRFEVEGVTCGTCVRKLEGALLGLDGVQTALVTRGEGDRATVAVTGAVPLVQLEAAVEEAGYGVVHPTVEVEVDGVTCGGCVRKLEGALEGTEGVEAACVTRLDEPTRGRASVRTRLSPEAVREMVREAGFEPVG